MMQNELEKFVRVNREAFDDEDPSERVWKNLEKQFVKEYSKVISISRSFLIRVSAVAAVLIIAAGAWLLRRNGSTNNGANNIAAVVVKHDTTNKLASAPIGQPAVDTAQTAQASKNTPEEADDNNGYNEEIYYYAKLAEIKFRQLKRIEKDEPVLYHSFYTEIKKLDSTYHNLQALLASNADKEAVLNAMLTNLKIQTEVLNKQLSIIKTIKQSKKKEYENNYKSA